MPQMHLPESVLMSIIGNKGSLSRLLLISFDEGFVGRDQNLIFFERKACIGQKSSKRLNMIKILLLMQMMVMTMTAIDVDKWKKGCY